MPAYAIIAAAIYIVGLILFSAFFGYVSYKNKGYAESIKADDVSFYLLWPVVIFALGIKAVANLAAEFGANVARKIQKQKT